MITDSYEIWEKTLESLERLRVNKAQDGFDCQTQVPMFGDHTVPNQLTSFWSNSPLIALKPTSNTWIRTECMCPFKLFCKNLHPQLY